MSAYDDALVVVSVIDELDPDHVLKLIDSRKSCFSQKLGSCIVVSEDLIMVCL